MEFGSVVVWLVAYLGLLAIGMSITGAVLSRLDDRGAGVAIPAAIAIVWIVTYVLGRVSIDTGLLAGIAVLGGLAIVARLRGSEIDRSIYLETAAVFTVAFLFMVAVRAVDPAVHPGGGEKFLDFGLLQSLLRANTLPPEDMWFAGESVQYYYGGHLVASLLARLTNTSARFAYNLAHAGFYAMVVTAAYGLGKSIAAHRGYPARLAGGASALFVGFASNLLVPAKLILLVLPGAISEAVAGILGFELRGVAISLSEFNYWTASRIIPGTINEFPLFGWLNGDMHAHMMSTPFLLLGATILYGYYRTPAESRGRRLGLLGALGPLAAMLAVVNTWSFPSIGGLTVLTVALAPASPTSLLPTRAKKLTDAGGWVRDELTRHTLAVITGVGVLAIGGVVSLPFWLQAASGQRGIGWLPERSGLGVLVIVHGAFLAVFALYYARYARPQLRRPLRAVGLVGMIVILSVVVDAAAVALFVPLLIVGWLLRRLGEYDELPTPGFETVLILGGIGLALLVEFVYVKEQAGPGRMNTVFKTYMQIWVLLATAMGVALVGLFADRRPSLGFDGPRWRRGFSVLAAILLVSTSIYGGLAMANHFRADGGYAQTDDPTLDALAFAETYHPNEYDAIQWIDENVEGQPNMVTKPGTNIYQWVNAPSSLTGVPTLAGWVHEVGYRGTDAYWDRVGDVETIFTGPPARQRSLLAAYDVELIYVGPLEREAYSDTTIQELDAVTVEERFGDVTLYRVDQAALDGSPS
ncbi:hypothetical protein Hrd1104_04500 [Halorhabdus sp. CBA1104]|uniref:DUF2298 domain-containing protein n=1 Tax=Halorhabdus sp. CBA1104 TaxID=1380432 RepID=UPI0012B2D041|nr:DUF2298 domain-containing protein [Halorhabdus sp. CBA1104]QGN06627.1 hypothetical protein Hrd1104_04500 [Halorhabdus sp. CBA1104]